MIFAILSLVIGVENAQQQVIDNIIKARIELARQCPPKPAVADPLEQKPKRETQVDMDYRIKHDLAVKQNRPLIVLVGGAEMTHCTKHGCYPIPSAWVVHKCQTFDLSGENVTKAIIVSNAHDGELWYLRTLPDGATIWQIDNIINAAVVVSR